MKKYFFTLLFIVFFNFVSFSQNKISYGIVGGVNISNSLNYVDHFGSHSKRSYSNRTSYYIGGDLELPLKLFNSPFLLNIELTFSQQGNVFKGTYENTIEKINQLNLPIKLKKELFNNFLLGVGPYIGYLTYVEDPFYKNEEQDYSDFDFGLVSSLEYRLFKKFTIQLRYLYGIKDILNREFEAGEYKHDTFNRVFQLGLGYRF